MTFCPTPSNHDLFRLRVVERDLAHVVGVDNLKYFLQLLFGCVVKSLPAILPSKMAAQNMYPNAK